MSTDNAVRRDVYSLGHGEHQLQVLDEEWDNAEVCALDGEQWPCPVAQAYQAGRKRGFAEVARHFDVLSESVKPAGTAAQIVRRYSRSDVVNEPCDGVR